MSKPHFLCVLTAVASIGVSAVAWTSPATAADRVAPERMVYVEGGDFKLGMTKDELRAFADQMLGKKKKLKSMMERSLIGKRKRTVKVDPFFIDTFEVTNQEYKLFLDMTGRQSPTHWEDGQIPEGKEHAPVTLVSLRDAKAYARWVGKRIPTEVEWEYAARGPDGRWFPWGNEWKDQGLCNNGLQPPADLTPVGKFTAGESPFKAQDMAGNVWEWTDTYIAPYPGNENNAAFNAARGYVIRGGCYRNVTHELASFIRNAAPPENSFEGVGFRCARSLATGVDVARFTVEELASQIPPGSNIDPSQAVGIEHVERESESGFVTNAHAFSVAPVGQLNYSTQDGLDKDAKKNGGVIAVAVLTTDAKIGEPQLDPGSYAIFYQTADKRAADRAAKAEADKAKETERKTRRSSSSRDQGDKSEEKEDKDAAEATVANIPEFVGYNRLLFVSADGRRSAEIRDPKFESVVGVQKTITIDKNLPPVGERVGRESTNVNGVRVQLGITPKFGSKSLTFSMVFKMPEVDLTQWAY